MLYICENGPIVTAIKSILGVQIAGYLEATVLPIFNQAFYKPFLLTPQTPSWIGYFYCQRLTFFHFEGPQNRRPRKEPFKVWRGKLAAFSATTVSSPKCKKIGSVWKAFPQVHSASQSQEEGKQEKRQPFLLERSRQDSWCVFVPQSCPSSLWPRGLSPTRRPCAWGSPGKSAGAGLHSFSVAMLSRRLIQEERE